MARRKPCLGTRGHRCPELTTHSSGRDRCRSQHQARRDAEWGSPAERGYGSEQPPTTRRVGQPR
jgi:hypothetical protein